MKTFIFGASGFAREVEWLITEINNTSKNTILVYRYVVHDSEFKDGHKINDILVIPESVYFEKYHTSELHNCIIAVGSGSIRQKIVNKIRSNKTIFPNLIHPSVIMDKRNISFGEGIIICAGTILTTNISIGDFVHVNLSTTIGHDTTIADFVTISPGVSISGNVTILSECFIGTGTRIIEKVEITNNIIVGSGAVVIKSLFSPGTYIGIPAKKIK
jgi:sugar O-acyltransferase (sialic acid O-acetyltransferase NeuD family)